MKRLQPWLSCMACITLCLAASDIFAKDGLEPLLSKQKKTAYAQGVEREAKGHSATSDRAKTDFVKTSRATPNKIVKDGSKSSLAGHQKTTHAKGGEPDVKGHIARDPKAKQNFMKATGYPQGRPGYVVAYIIPLKQGGADAPSNMQWQSKPAAKAKDKAK
jgi:hypothetical protein